MAIAPYDNEYDYLVDPNDEMFKGGISYEDPNVLADRSGTSTGADVEQAAQQSSGGYSGAALPPSPTPAPTSTPSAGDPKAFFFSLTQGLPPNSQSLLSIEKQLNAQGITVLRNAQGIAGKVRLPSGQIIDVGGNFSGGDPSRMSWQWYQGTSAAKAPTSGTAPRALPTPAGATSPALSNTLTASLLSQFGQQPAQSAEFETALRSAISELLRTGMQSGLPDTGTSPQARQFALSSTREAERARSDAMERASLQPGGTASGKALSDVEGINQARAEAQARFEVGLTQQLLTERQQKLALALQTGAGMLNAEQERTLRAELAAVDAALQQNRLQLDWYNSQNSNQQFYDDLGFRIGSREADLNSQATGALF
jgi:hypothetical protein